jgi:hypothetical protein
LKKLERWVGVVAVLNLAMIAILYGPPYFSNASKPVRGIANPILAMEVVRNIDEVDAVLSDLPSPDREAMRLKQYADFGFIVCYSALFILLAKLLGARAIAVIGIAGAVCDVIENIGILRIVNVSLGHTTQTTIDAIRYPSLSKWALVSVATGLLSIAALRTNSKGLRVVGALNLIAALLGLYGLFDNVFLAWSGLPMLAGFLCLGILYFRPYYVRRRA